MKRARHRHAHRRRRAPRTRSGAGGPRRAGSRSSAQTLEPVVSAEELARVRSEFADVAVSGPGDGHGGREVLHADAQGSSARPSSSRPTTRAGSPRGPTRRSSAAIVHAAAKKAGAEVQAKDAVVTFSGRTPSVKPHVSGLALDDASLRTRGLEGDRRARRAPPPWRRKVVGADVHDRRGQGDAAQGADLLLHDVLPAGPAPRVQHQARRPGSSTARTSRPGEQFSMNGILGQRTAREGLHQGGHHPRRPRREPLRRRHLAGVDDDLQRRLLLRDAARRVDPALLLHLALPRGPRGDDLVARPAQQVHEHHRRWRAHPGPRHRHLDHGELLRHEEVRRHGDEERAPRHRPAQEDTPTTTPSASPSPRSSASRSTSGASSSRAARSSRPRSTRRPTAPRTTSPAPTPSPADRRPGGRAVGRRLRLT